MPTWVQRLLIFFGILFALWLIVYIAFRTPPVQRYVTGLISEELSKQLDTKVTLEGVDIEWLDGVELAGVYIEDQQQDTLLYAGLVAAYIDPSALLNSTAYIELVEIRDTYINLYQPEGQDDLNYAFIPEAFASEDTTATPEDTTASSWTIELYQVQLDDIRFDYRAEGTEVAMSLGELSMLFESLGLDESYIQGDELAIDELTLALALPPTDTAAAADTAAYEPPPTASSAEVDSSNIINPSGFRYALNELVIANSQLAYRVKGSEDTTLQQINFEDLIADQLHLEVEDLYVGDTEIKLAIPQFSFVEAKSGFRVDELTATTQIDMPRIAGQLTALQTNHSTLNGSIELDMTLVESTAELVQSLAIQSQLDEAVIGLADARYFTNALDSLPAVRELSPRLTWQVAMDDGDGSIEQMAVDMGDKASLRLNGSFRNVAAALDSTTTESPYLNIRVPEFSADLGFIEELIPPESQQYIPATDDPELVLTASAEGYLNDLEAEATLQSGVGDLVADAHYVQQAAYTDLQATMEADNFNLGQLLRPFVGDTLARDFGQLSFRTDADVRQRTVVGDTSLQQADVELVVGELAYQGYTYRDLVVQSNMAGDQIEADVRYEDSLLNLTADLGANLEQEAYQADVRLKNTNLLRLNLLSDSVIITNSELQADIQGTDPDKITGFVKLADTEVIKGRQTYVQDTLLFTAEDTDEGRRLTLLADRMEAIVAGRFTVAELPRALEDFQQYYFAASPATAASVDTVDVRETGAQRVNLRVAVEQTPRLAEAFVPELDIPEPILMVAEFNSTNHYLDFDANVPHLAYDGYVVDSLSFNAQTDDRRIDMLLRANNVVASGVSLPRVRLEGHLTGEAEQDAAAEPLAATVADLNLKMGASTSPYRLDLSTEIRSGTDTIAVLLDSLELMVEDAEWNIPRNARITYADNYLNIEDFQLTQNDQEIVLRTEQEDNSTTLRLLIEQLQLAPLLTAFDLEDYRVAGTLSGQTEVYDMFTPGPVDADFKIEELAVQDTVLGDVVLAVEKGIPASETEDLVDVLFTVKGEANDLKVAGAYNLAAGPEEEALDFQVDLNQLALGRWQPLVRDVFKELAGTLRADMTIRGSTESPVIRGNLVFADEVLFVPVMTGAPLYIENQKLEFTGDQMALNNFTLLDSARTPAVIDGTVAFADLANPNLDLTFSTEEFLFVSSEEYENEEFYGRAVASADMSIDGPANAVTVAGEMTAEEGTDMIIALIEGPEEAARAGFIEFVDASAFARADTVLQDSLQAIAPPEEEADSTETTGYQYALDLVVNVDPAARFTTIIDPASGDKLVVSGEANLRVSQTLGGDLTMQGNYVVNSGSYQLTFAKVVKKRFTVREGSSLVWSGDPANATMDMTAVYTVEDAQLGELVPSTPQADDLEGPINVLLFITGELEAPELTFGLEVPDVESLGGLAAQQVNSALESIEQNETQLYKNVFGLIVLGKLLPQGEGLASDGGGGGAGQVVNEQINSSVSQLLTSQLSQLSEQYLGGVEIDVGLESNEAGSGAAAGRDVNVGVSRDLFGDRLSVSVGGTTAGGGFAGEFEVLYRITEDGNLNLKAFQSTERNPLTNQIDDDAGVSLLYRNSFDEFFAGEQADQTLKSRSIEEKEQQSTPPPTGQRTSERRPGQRNDD